MFYTKYWRNFCWIFLSLVIVGCGTTPTQVTKNTLGTASQVDDAQGEELLLYRKAITLLNDNQLPEAEHSFLEMTKLRPELAGPWANLALINIKRNNIDKADEFVKIALSKNSSMPQALNLSGYIESQKGQINKAKELYQQAILQKSDYALAHYNLALLYDIYLQDIANAVKHYEVYLSLIKYEDEKTKNWVAELKLNI